MNVNNLKHQFINKGFVVVPIPDLLNRIPTLINSFDTVINKAESLGAKGLVKIRKSDLEDMSGSGWSWGCDHIFAPELLNQDLLDIASLEPIPFIVRYILGNRIRWTGGHGHWSPKNYDYYLHWHRDTRPNLWKNAHFEPCSHVQVCVALQKEAVIWLVPGSHLRYLEEWEYKYIEGDDKHNEHPHQIIPEIPAGSALIFNTYTLHRAQCSKNDKRRSIHFGFTKTDNTIQEVYRLGKHFDWLSEQNFINAQSTFLQQCIREQIVWQQKM